MNAVYFFSGTGNSRALAMRVASGLAPCECVEITRELLDGENLVSDLERVLVVFPSYAYGLPAMVREFLSREFFRAEYIALAVTCGTSPGGTLTSARKILKKRGLETSLGFTVRTVENFLPIFGEQSGERVSERIGNQNRLAEELTAAIAAKRVERVGGFHPISGCVSGIFRAATPILASRIRVSEACTSCGLCRRVCPAAAITLEKGIPRIDRKRCNQCQACLNVCPKQALSMWKHKPGCRQYLNPEVTVNELLKRK